MSTPKIYSLAGKGFVIKKTIPAGRFRRVYRRQRDNISSYYIVPPQLGSSRDFGSIEINFKVPVSDAELCLTR